MQEKKLSQATVNIIIMLFDHTSEAHAHMSSAAANIPALEKIVDLETLKLILRVSVHPMVQLAIPERFLDLIHNPDVETLRSATMQIKQDLLLIPTRPCLVREPDNGLMCLLCAVVWLKLSKVFLNKGTQKEAAGLFNIWEKQLSRLIMGHKYWGGMDRTLGSKKRKVAEEKAENVKKTKKVVDPEGGDVMSSRLRAWSVSDNR